MGTVGGAGGRIVGLNRQDRLINPFNQTGCNYGGKAPVNLLVMTSANGSVGGRGRGRRRRRRLDLQVLQADGEMNGFLKPKILLLPDERKEGGEKEGGGDLLR